MLRVLRKKILPFICADRRKMLRNKHVRGDLSPHMRSTFQGHYWTRALVGAREGLLHSWFRRLFQVAACKGLELPEGKEIFASYFVFFSARSELKPEKSLCILQKRLQEISRTLFFVFRSLLAAISVDLKASALTNKQQCSNGQPHSSHRSRSQISQYKNNSRTVGKCFHPAELGAHVFRSQWQDKHPPSWDIQWLFCSDVYPKTFVMGACSKCNTWRLSAGERILSGVCLVPLSVRHAQQRRKMWVLLWFADVATCAALDLWPLSR